MFDEDSIIAIYFSFLEDGLKVVVVVEIELSRPVGLVVSDPAQIHPTLLEDVHLYWVETVLLQLQRIINALYLKLGVL